MSKPDSSNDSADFALPALAADIVETDQLIGQINILARTQSTLEEAAAYLGYLPDAFARFLATHPRSGQAWFSGPAAGRAGLRMAQFQAARKGDSTMLVWLSRQHLGQSENGRSDDHADTRPIRDAWDNLASWRMTRLG